MPIYFIQSSDRKGPIKIGYASDINKRFNKIQNMSPVRLCILNTLEADKDREKAIHKHFESLRLWGEWFRATEELLEIVKTPTKCLKFKKVEKIQQSNIMAIKTAIISDTIWSKALKKARENSMSLSKVLRILLEKWIIGEINIRPR